MAITHDGLVGKKVYNPDAGMVGEVSDIGFSVGASQPMLLIKGPDGSMAEVPWGSVGSAKDIVIMKEAVDMTKFRKASTFAPTQQAKAPDPQVRAAVNAPEPAAGTKRFCTSCGKELTWIPEYKRWYCYKEKKYA